MKLIDKQALLKLIEQLPMLDSQQKYHLQTRWLQYVLWWDERARRSRWKSFTLRSMVIIGGAAIPTLVSLHVREPWSAYIYAATVVVSLIVAASAGLEEVFRFGEIWREKRGAAELLKIEGYKFFQLIGPDEGKSHDIAYADFAATVESMIEHEIKDYLITVQPQKKEK